MRGAVKNAPGSVSTPSHLVSHDIINRSIDCMELSASGFFLSQDAFSAQWAPFIPSICQHMPTSTWRERFLGTALLPQPSPETSHGLPKDPDVAGDGSPSVGGTARGGAGRRYLDAIQNNASSSCCPGPAYREGGHQSAQPAQPTLIDLTGDSKVGEEEERPITGGLAPTGPHH